MTATKILVFAGSTRAGSLSTKLAAAAAKELALADADVTRISLADYALPIYDGDLEKEVGIPDNATQLARLIAAHQGAFIATPEYNNSVPPLLKNTIDWISRVESSKVPYRNRVFAVGSVSNGPIGGARALPDLRKIAQAGLGAIPIPEKIEVGRAREAFTESGELAVEPVAKLLSRVCRSLVALAGRLAD
ncbi:NADPH-dependent FMN reductase [Bauldia sp.]|uniref:NADPH-dependent FMN reductase n=1 Tax=Bauldia sp. TaxID=2575872 RepID=UPI003BAA4E40